MNNIIIFYDISNTKRRNKLVKVLESFGIRIQKSVFECFINNSKYKELLKLIEKLKYDEKNDSVILIELKNGIKKEIGKEYKPNIHIDIDMVI